MQFLLYYLLICNSLYISVNITNDWVVLVRILRPMTTRNISVKSRLNLAYSKKNVTDINRDNSRSLTGL